MLIEFLQISFDFAENALMIEFNLDGNLDAEEEEDETESQASPSQRIGHIAVKYNNYILVWGGYKVLKVACLMFFLNF